MIDCVADEGVGPEDFAEPGKQPFDHVYETLFMHVIYYLIVVATES